MPNRHPPRSSIPAVKSAERGTSPRAKREAKGWETQNSRYSQVRGFRSRSPPQDGLSPPSHPANRSRPEGTLPNHRQPPSSENNDNVHTRNAGSSFSKAQTPTYTGVAQANKTDHLPKVALPRHPKEKETGEEDTQEHNETQATYRRRAIQARPGEDPFSFLLPSSSPPFTPSLPQRSGNMKNPRIQRLTAPAATSMHACVRVHKP